MKNPLTRGKGFLGVKVLRYALNVPNLLNVLVLARPRFPRSPERLFPRKGLVHLLNKRFSRSGPPNTFRHSQLELSCGLVKTNHVFLPLSDILSVLIPCLCLGCGLYWDSLPWLFELPLPGLITEAHSNSSGFFSGVESGRLWGIDANRLWASLNVATGSTNFWPTEPINNREAGGEPAKPYLPSRMNVCGLDGRSGQVKEHVKAELVQRPIRGLELAR